MSPCFQPPKPQTHLDAVRDRHVALSERELLLEARDVALEELHLLDCVKFTVGVKFAVSGAMFMSEASLEVLKYEL